MREGTPLRLDLAWYAGHDPGRGDLVGLVFGGDERLLVKIVRGLPGDAFAVEGERILIGGAELVNSEGTPYRIRSTMLGLYARDYPVIPADTYLLLGDDPTGSLDSSRFGLVARGDLAGRITRLDVPAGGG